MKKHEHKLTGRFRISYGLLDPQDSDDLLSVGCKEAVFESFLADKVRSIKAIDIDSAIMERNSRTIPGITFEYGDILAGTSYQSEQFDKIIFLEVIEHLPIGTEQQALKEIYRLLKKGGTLVLSTPNATVLTGIFDPAYWLIGHRHYKLSAIESMLRQTGFVIEKSFVGGGFIELFWIPVFYLLIRLKLAKYAEPLMNNIIDSEYNDRGFYTLMLKCKK